MADMADRPTDGVPTGAPQTYKLPPIGNAKYGMYSRLELVIMGLACGLEVEIDGTYYAIIEGQFFFKTSRSIRGRPGYWETIHINNNYAGFGHLIHAINNRMTDKEVWKLYGDLHAIPARGWQQLRSESGLKLLGGSYAEPTQQPDPEAEHIEPFNPEQDSGVRSEVFALGRTESPCGVEYKPKPETE